MPPRLDVPLYQAFPPAEARRILRRLEFHYVPKHASWLNMVEIEIGCAAMWCIPQVARMEDVLDLYAEVPSDQ